MQTYIDAVDGALIRTPERGEARLRVAGNRGDLGPIRKSETPAGGSDARCQRATGSVKVKVLPWFSPGL